MHDTLKNWPYGSMCIVSKTRYEGVIVPTALCGAEAWGMRGPERRKVNVLDMKCLRNLVGVSRMYGVRNEDGRRRA